MLWDSKVNWFSRNSSEQADGAISQISVQDLKAALDKDSSLHLIDVRTREEVDAAHLEATKARIEYHEIAEKINTDDFPKDQPIYLICRVGRRSMIAARELREVGFEKIFNVAGGITDWIHAGFPVIKH